ncbi:single-stranded-DNA-specific exonuclease RecJ [Candidatus Chlorohelix sp.]|uniref:single-stranded-DNA-specific exonuclease RecJ n=1 Tax=Candidatus Chlorohelix sp. TaxID=3139201 RepID=UPI003024AAAD
MSQADMPESGNPSATLSKGRRERVWVMPTPVPPEFLEAVSAAGYGALTAQLLYNRDLRTPEAIDYFFNADYSRLADPYLIKDMDKAVKRIQQALSAHETLAIYGDFDVDGVTACSLLVQYFRSLGVKVIPRIPRRVEEGYGLNPTALKNLHKQGVTLVITVDCGVSNVDEVAVANGLGMDIIVTDHHRPPEVLPQAYAILNVRQEGCQYPYKGVAGVGMAFHLVRALSKAGIKSNGLKPSDLLDLVALGTVADVSPLNGENRVLVASGLRALNRTTRPGIIALIDAVGLKQGELDASSIGFSLAPRINAAGRVDDAILAYQLLLTDSLPEARELASQLNSKNRERQDMLSTVLEEAHYQVTEKKLFEKNKLMLLSGTNWQAGIVGLVAGRLCEEYYRPVVVVQRSDGICKGSARSIYAFNIIDALSECADLLERFGGHRQAAGFTVLASKLEALESRLCKIADRMPDSDLQPRLLVDAIIEPDQLMPTYTESCLLAPFGSENLQPLYACTGLKVREARLVGNDGVHLRLKLFNPNNRKTLEGIAFRAGWRAGDIKPGKTIDVAFNLEQTMWHGQKRLEVYIKDMRFSA